MRRDVSVHLELDVVEPARVYLQVAPAVTRSGTPELTEVFAARLDGQPAVPTELASPHGGRVHRLDVAPGRLVVDYSAAIRGRAERPSLDEIDLFEYVRPSRYAESDRLAGFAFSEFSGLSAEQLLQGVSSWVGSRLAYLPGSSKPTDGAVETLLAGEGVCRDFAHLTVGLLRSMDVPARVVAVYAPGLAPMDFHAVVEAHVGGAWHVVDPTLLAPRSTMVRIATGRDCADTAFASTYGGLVVLLESSVTATVEGSLPADDPRDLAVLG